MWLSWWNLYRTEEQCWGILYECFCFPQLYYMMEANIVLFTPPYLWDNFSYLLLCRLHQNQRRRKKTDFEKTEKCWISELISATNQLLPSIQYIHIHLLPEKYLDMCTSNFRYFKTGYMNNIQVLSSLKGRLSLLFKVMFQPKSLFVSQYDYWIVSTPLINWLVVRWVISQS